MKKAFILAIAAFQFCFAFGQSNNRTQVMTLGVFHFNFPNLDVHKFAKEDQIDVYDAKYQVEIEDIVQRLAKFQPTIIVIESRVAEQKMIDSIYNAYLNGTHKLKRSEDEQIGFRVAKMMNLETLYCVDEWGNFTDNIIKLSNGTDSVKTENFENYFTNNPDTSKKFNPKNIFKTKGIREDFIQINNPDNIRHSLGNYLIGIFKYEEKPYDFTGVDWETGRWFSRNLKIYRNIQRIKVTPNDRILVIFGAGHMNILNYLFDCSTEYQLVSPIPYLK